MVNNEQRERILATYRQWVYGYKKIAHELGLTRDQVRHVIISANRKRPGTPMTSFDPNDHQVKKANSAYEDRDLSEFATDAEKIEYLQDENRLLRALLVEYQKEFLPEALSSFPMFQSSEEASADDLAIAPKVKEKKPKRSLKKKRAKEA